MSIDTTRRTLLKAAPFAAVAATLPVTAMARPITDRTAWDAAMATYRKVMTEDAAFMPGYLKTFERCDAETKRVPHISVGPSAHTGRGEISTSDHWYVSRCRKDVAALDEGRMRLDPLPDLIEHERQMRALVAADDERNATIAAIRARYGIAALDDRSEALGEQICESQSTLMDMPAPDLAALRWKLDHITQEAREKGGSLPCYSNDYVRQTFADMARLLPEGA